MNLLESVGERHYYIHVTSIENVPSIMTKGLVPNHNGGNYDDAKWTSLDGVYASKQMVQLQNYLRAHDIEDYGVIVLEVTPGDALPDEDIININFHAAFDKALKANQMDEDDAMIAYEESGGEIDNQPFWDQIIEGFRQSIGPGTASADDVRELLDYWFSLTFMDSGDAEMYWADLKDKFVRAHPQMVNAITGDRHSIRVPSVVTTEGPTRIVGVLEVEGHDEPRVLLNNVPAEAKAIVNGMLEALI